MRQCGECNLCCKLLPVQELDKGANESCRHQRFRKGCTVYNKPGMPMSCRLWNCAWLVDDKATDLSRPDRSRCVVDIMPDYVKVQDNETGEIQTVPVVQIWCDPEQREAWHALKPYIARRAEQDGCLALIRFNNKDAITVIAPVMTDHGAWIVDTSRMQEEDQHSVEDIFRAIGGLP